MAQRILGCHSALTVSVFLYSSSFVEQLEKVKLLEAQVEALEQDNSAQKDKASKLQGKAKAAAKKKKGILFVLLCPSSSFLLFSCFPCFGKAKKLVVVKG